MPPVRAVLFDLDGVLIDSYALWFHLLNQAAQHFGKPPISDKAFHDTWGQGIEADIAAFFPGLTVEQLAAYFQAHYAEFLTHIEKIPGAQEALYSVKHLYAQGPKRRLTGCITNSMGGIARQALEQVALLSLLDRVLGADEAQCSKPDPRGVLKLCRQLGVKPYEAILVGDSAYDEEAAKGAGVTFVGYKRDSRYQLTDLAQLRTWIEWYEAQG